MKTWIPMLVIVISVTLFSAWIEPGVGVLVAFGVLPYLITLYILRQYHIDSIEQCVREYHELHHIRHYSPE